MFGHIVQKVIRMFMMGGGHIYILNISQNCTKNFALTFLIKRMFGFPVMTENSPLPSSWASDR